MSNIQLDYSDITDIFKEKLKIENIVKKAEVGEIYDGTIARVNDNYAFVTLFEGTDGFLHISDWSYERTSIQTNDNVRIIKDI